MTPYRSNPTDPRCEHCDEILEPFHVCIAKGEVLDRFATLYGISRQTGESDESLRLRLIKVHNTVGIE